MEAVYEIENEKEMPFGMLHNNFNFSMEIDGKEYANVSEYLYMNLFRFLLYKYNEKLKSTKLKGVMWVDTCIASPESCDFVKHFLKVDDDKSVFEKFQESVENFRRQIMSHHYTKVLTEKLLSDDELLSKFISLKEKEFVFRYDDKLLGVNKNNEGDNMVGLILKNIHNLFGSQNMFVLIFKPYIVYCILKYYLTVELNDFQLLKSYVDLGRLISVSKGEVDLMNKIINEFQEHHNIKSLKTFQFEDDIDNEEFCFILISSIKDPIILIEYTINKYFNVLLCRMNEFRKKIILKVFIQQKFVSTVGEIEKELRSVNVSKLADTILTLYISRKLPIDIQSLIDVELGRFVFISSFSKIFSEEILKAKSVDESKKEIKRVYEFDSGVKFITESISKLKDFFNFFAFDVGSVKTMLLRIGLCRKFGQSCSVVANEFFKSHNTGLIDEYKSARHLKDLQHLLTTIGTIEIKYNDKDEFVMEFMGPYLKTLNDKIIKETTKTPEAKEQFKYEWKESLEQFVEQDLFMSNWLYRTSSYVVNFVNILLEYVDGKDNIKKIQDILICLGVSDEFTMSSYTTPPFFNNMIGKLQEYDSKVTKLIWNFVMYNILVMYKDRTNFFKNNYQAKIKELLVFFYLKLQREPNCIIEYVEEKKEYKLLSCVVKASFNIEKILSGLELHNLKRNQKVNLIASILLNKKVNSTAKKSILKKKDNEEFIQQMIYANDLEGLSVQEVLEIFCFVENEKMSNILWSRINLF